MGRGLIGELKKAMQMGVDLNSDEERNKVFGNVTFRVRYLDETSEQLHGTCIINLAQVKDQNDWGQIRGKKIATVFQDPMTSLNPIITIGKQITSIIMKHQGCSEVEARAKALEMMEKDEGWLKNELHKRGYESYKDIFFAEWNELIDDERGKAGELYIVERTEKRD